MTNHNIHLTEEQEKGFRLLLSIKFHSLRRYAGAGIIQIFLVTLSFLFFTPIICF